MIYSTSRFELTLDCNSDKFQKLLNRAYRNSNMETDEDRADVHVDRAASDSGIAVEYYDGTYKKKIKLVVNPTALLGGDDMKKLWKPSGENTSRFLRKLEKHIDDYFGSKYQLSDFKLNNIHYAVNIDVGDRKSVSAYIRVMQNIGRVKGYSPPRNKHGGQCDSKHSFCLEGNSNGIGFTTYDSEAVFKRKDAKGMLRLEVSLMKNKAIRKYANETDTPKQLEHLALNSRNIFLEIFVHVVPYGDYYKKNDAVKIITENVPKRKLRMKMLKLLELIPEKKSLHLAQKAMNDRNIDKIMKLFEQLNLSPITISKRHNVNYLDTLYVHLFSG